MNIFDSLFLDTPTISVFEVFLNILLSSILGFLISIIYRRTYKGYSYSSSFVNMLVIITMVTSIVIMVIGNNLARAFGLVGAMSIIRFRTVVKDTRDIAFVFFALALGMASGAGNYMIGIIGCFLVSVAIMIMYLTNYGIFMNQDLLLRFFMLPQHEDKSVYSIVFQKYLKNYTLLNIKSARLGQFLELSFHIRLKNPSQHHAFVEEMSSLEGIERVTLIFSEHEDS